MGRRKIEIQPITHDRNRSVTFLKRKNGLFKKAYELGVLCSVDVCVIVFAHNGKLHEYSSGDSGAIIDRRLKYAGDRDLRRPADFNNIKGSGGGADKGGDSDLEDEGDSADDIPSTRPPPSKKSRGSRHSPLAKTGLGNSGIDLPSVPPTSTSASFANDVRMAHSNSYLSGTSSHPSSLPPAAHPLSIAASQTYLPHERHGQDSPATSLAQHHHQLAQQFLVNQLQNINPNLNAHPAPPSSGFMFLGGPGGAPPRPTLPFGGPADGQQHTPSASAYSSAFLNSLLGHAAAAAAVAGGGGGGDFLRPSHHPKPPQQGQPFGNLDWPTLSSSRITSSSTNTTNSSQPQPPSRSDGETPSSMSVSSGHGGSGSPPPPPLRQAPPVNPEVDNGWLELLLGGGSGGGGAGGGGANGGGDPPSALFHQSTSWKNPPQGPESRSGTPVDGVAIAGSGGLKRPRGGSSSVSLDGQPGMVLDDADSEEADEDDGEEGSSVEKKKTKR